MQRIVLVLAAEHLERALELGLAAHERVARVKHVVDARHEPTPTLLVAAFGRGVSGGHSPASGHRVIALHHIAKQVDERTLDLCLQSIERL